MRQRLSGVFAAFSVLLLVALLAPNQAQAVEFVVNSTLDQVDANPGDGICASSAGLCTLRAAVMETNALPNTPTFAPVPDTIRIPPGEYRLTIDDYDDAGLSGDLDLLDGVRILGTASNAEIEVGFTSRFQDYQLVGDGIIEVHAGVRVEIESIALVKGGTGSGNGSAITNEGDLHLRQVRLEDNLTRQFISRRAVENRGSLFVENSAFRRNYSESHPGGAGAITNEGTLVILNSTVANNGSEYSPALGNSGSALIVGSTFEGNYSEPAGAIRNSGVLSILRSSFVGNTSKFGGSGIVNDVTGILDIRDSELRDNSANEHPRGVAIQNHGRVAVSGTTITGNRGSSGPGYQDGVGVGVYSSGQTYIIDSTISGNRGRHSAVYSESGHTTIINSSVVFNDADSGDSGGIGGRNLAISGSIVAGNVGLQAPKDCIGTITSGGHNIFGDGTGCTRFDATDLVGTTDAPIDPLLGPLANNGGPTQTHALLGGSPAIDGVPVENCIADLDQNPATPDTPLDVDQRGTHRPGGTACDIGPYEVTDGELAAAQCAADLGTAQDEAAQCSASLGGCQGDLTQCGVDLGACLAIPPGLPDQDGDGEADSTDRCASTPTGLPVDGDGCSRAQFCEGIQVSGLGHVALCVLSDWRNDEPLRIPNDCRTVRIANRWFGLGCVAR